MYVILAILLSILVIEIYTIIPKNEKMETNNYLVESDKKENLLFNKYTVKEGTTVLKTPGSILIKDHYNVVLKYKDESVLMEKDIIYNIDVDFEVETLNINNGNVIYYYISA